jgi:2-polyprenyl-3-methyl-5-hydroxy-6-metoxy-1,4-benzoquinol methylase
MSGFDAEYYRKLYESAETRVYGPEEIAHLCRGVTGFIDFMGMPLESVLDAGAGTGMVRDWFVRERPAAKVRSTDISEYACQNYGHERHDLATWCDGEYDLIVCHGVLAYLKDEACADAIANLGKMCRGFLYVSLVTQEDITQAAVDFKTTDLDGIEWREARFYLDLLKRDFIRLGLGLFYRRGGPLHLASLERCG